MFKCKFCEKEYEKIQQLGGHIVYCNNNPDKREKKTSKKIFNLKCETCGEDYEILETQHNLDNNKYRKNCSRKCANKRSHTEEVKEKISKKLLGLKKIDRKKICSLCNDIFLYKNKKQKFCSRNCNTINNNNNGMGIKGGLASSAKQAEDRRSKNEIVFGERCKDYFSNVTFNENFFNGWDADIILHDAKIAVMWNGKWHYEKITEKHSVKQVQNRDSIKIKEIEKLGYIPYIIKDMGKFSEKKVQLEWDIFLNWLNEKNILVI